MTSTSTLARSTEQEGVATSNERASSLTFTSFKTLATLPEEPDWLWHGYLAPGAFTLLAGRQFKGKSMLIGGLLQALATGADFLGHSTRQSSALLVTEEDDTILRQRARLFGLLEVEAAILSRTGGVTRHPWPDLIAKATDHAVFEGHKLLIVDTFSGLAQLGDDQENDAGAVAERLRPLQTAASLGLSILLLHHMNSYGRPRGSSALQGIPDILLAFHREQGNGFRLEADSRYPSATARKIRGQLIQEEGGWKYVRTDRDQEATEAPSNAGARLREALAVADSAGMTYEELVGPARMSLSQVKSFLTEWYGQGVVTRSGLGVKGDPFRWLFP